MTDPYTIAAIGGAVGGAASTFVIKSWDSGS